MRTNTVGTIRRVLAGGAVVLVLAACGSSDDGADDGGDTAATTADDQSANTDNGGSDEAGAESDSGDSDGDDSGGGDFCDQIRALDETPAGDDDLSVAAEQFDKLIDSAPDDLRDDLEVVSGAFAEVAELDVDDPEAFTLIFEVFGRPDVVEAAENLERFGVEECGLEPSSDADVGVGAS